MIAGQKLKKGNNEICLFPLEYMYITQGEYGEYSHSGILAIDFAGYGNTGVINNCPYYAPVSCICVASLPENNERIFTSLSPVILPDGSNDYITWVQAHDNNPVASVGQTFTQGDLIGHTGDYGQATGDHVHFNFARGQYLGYESIGGNYQLINSIHIYNTCYVNNTELIETLNYNWRNYIVGSSKKNKFKWVLFTPNRRKKLTK